MLSPLDTPDIANAPIRSRNVRKGVTAYQYRNGIINIRGQRYSMYTMNEAISKFRKDFPAKYFK